MKRITDEPELLTNGITCDETLISPPARMEKGQMSKPKLIVFFDINDVIKIERVPEGQTVNQKYYREVIIKMRETGKKIMDSAVG